jgi:hypothetical protein
LEGSSDDEFFEKPITRTFDSINSGSDFIFPSPASDDLRDLHPSTVHIFRLWQKFLDSINPLIKILHAPTVQQQVLDASADLDNIPKGVEALMFGIYCTAVTSFDEPECAATFGESKPTLLTRYHAGARQALSRAGLLRSSDMTILQAFVLYIVGCYQRRLRSETSANFVADLMSQLHGRPAFPLLPHWHCCSNRSKDGAKLRWHELRPSTL